MTKRKPKSQHKRNGRPPVPIDLALVTRLAQRQGSIREIAACLGIDEKALRQRARKDPALSAAIKQGHKTGQMTLRTRLFNAAMEGVPAPLIFACKNYLGMTDKVNTEVTGKNGGPVAIENTVSGIAARARAAKAAREAKKSK